MEYAESRWRSGEKGVGFIRVRSMEHAQLRDHGLFILPNTLIVD